MKTAGCGLSMVTEKTESFQDVWARIFPLFAENFRLTDEEKERFSRNSVLQLIGYTPWLAGCADRERTALTNMAVFMISSFGESRFVFDHTPADDLSPVARLAPLMNFRGGDRAIINRAMNMLALIIVNGYNRDRDKDADMGGYNPLNSGAWDYEAVTAKLNEEIYRVSCPEMDQVLSSRELARGSWY
jgi:hypothetical protein